jgi:hypothetical protein
MRTADACVFWPGTKAQPAARRRPTHRVQLRAFYHYLCGQHRFALTGEQASGRYAGATR